MDIPTSEPVREDDNLSPSRRRRRQRMILPSEPNERARFLNDLAHRMSPSLDFFLFSLLAGVLLGAALLLDSPALYVLAALVAPFLAPAIGISLAVMVGSLGYFFRSLATFGIGSLLVFLCGAVAGSLLRFFPTLKITQAIYHTHFSIPDFAVLVLGASLATLLSVRSSISKPLVASVALAYELYLPLGAAGFGLLSGQPGLWPDGLLVFAVHLAGAALVGLLMLVISGLRPNGLFGYSIGSTIVLVCIVAIIALSGMGTAVGTQMALRPPSPPLTATLTLTPAPSIPPTPTLTSLPPTITTTPTKTLIPSATTTLTISPEPTLALAKINAREGGGANLHTKPEFNSPVVITLANGWPVFVYPEAVQSEGVIWRRVKVQDGAEGWIWEDLLATATPKPGW